MVSETRQKEFDSLYAETLRYCQVTEHNVVMILALLLEGNPDENLKQIREERKTLGECIHAIRDIDAKRNNPFFTKNDYHVLTSIRNERNHFVHEAYNEYLFKNGETALNSFNEEYKRLKKFHDDMLLVARASQNARIAAAKSKI